MQLAVFTELAKSDVITKVIISAEPSDNRMRAVVDVITIFGQTIRLTTSTKKTRYFKDSIQALETLSRLTGELKNVKVKIKTL